MIIHDYVVQIEKILTEYDSKHFAIARDKKKTKQQKLDAAKEWREHCKEMADILTVYLWGEIETIGTANRLGAGLVWNEIQRAEANLRAAKDHAEYGTGIPSDFYDIARLKAEMLINDYTDPNEFLKQYNDAATNTRLYIQDFAPILLRTVSQEPHWAIVLQRIKTDADSRRRTPQLMQAEAVHNTVMNEVSEAYAVLKRVNDAWNTEYSSAALRGIQYSKSVDFLNSGIVTTISCNKVSWTATNYRIHRF